MKLTCFVCRLVPGLLLAIAPLLAACQATMSLEEAKQVTASFAGSSFVPPPRTINDITAILDQQKLADPEAAAKARALADQPLPKTTDPAILADFYFQRGMAAREIGRAKQEIDDLGKALEWAERAGGRSQTPYDEIVFELAAAEVSSGNFSDAITHLQKAIAMTPLDRRGALVKNYAMLVRLYASAGDFQTAQFNAGQLLALVAESRNWRNQLPEWIAFRQAQAADAQARLAEAQGRFAEAEAFYREAIGWLERDPVASKHTFLDNLTGQLARTLALQGRLLEAENEARKALLSILSKRGRYSTHTASVLGSLLAVILGQGRYAEAETLARARIDIYQKTGSSEESVQLAGTRNQLGSALVAQGRWQEALAERETIERGLRGDPENLRRYFGGNVSWALALLRIGQPDQALEILHVALERNQRLLGEKAQATAGVRGLMGMAYAVRGDKPRALKEFKEATSILLMRSPEAEEESASRPARDQRLNLILASYMSLLADIRGTSFEKEANIDAAAEAFRLADVARGRSVQRALDAGAARAAAKTPALADLVRRDQDAKKQISALFGVLASTLSAPTDQQNPKIIANLRGQIDTLRRAQRAIGEQIEKEFPAYAQLINPAPATLEQARAGLKPGEALISSYVSRERTFIWAIPKNGEVAFAAAPIGESALGEMVSTLRKALDPNVQILGDIPEFDLTTAHRLYAALLEPVAAGWQRAESLLVVPHGPLGHLPFAVLPTKPVTLAAESGALFSKYRAVPWLARTHGVTVLPSVASLGTLRALPPGDPKRRPFVGFGDPYFNPRQASRATREREPMEVASVATRGVPIKLRSSPKTETFDSSQLAMLPRLPETADEIRGIALAMNADLTKEVFIGAQANEKVVKTIDLFNYRVIAFATHGLVPGDLDGLTQPALALSSPEVAQVEGDGLLTMEEILSLRLNADWVVLSACNTASGNGTGSEAISGLGRAFFYAGARALLVSSWPVETNSARELTTELFRRQSVNPGLSRAKALQQTMNAMIDGPGFVDPKTKTVIFSYAHPIFWAPFALVGDGG